MTLVYLSARRFDMAAHTLHPDSHEYGLADDCPRCAEHARDPGQGLDDRNLSSIIQRVEEDLPPRSRNEAVAMAYVRNVQRFGERVKRLLAIVQEAPPLIVCDRECPECNPPAFDGPDEATPAE